MRRAALARASLVAAAALLLVPALAGAQRVYVANSGDGTVSVLESVTNTAVAPPIDVPAGPTDVAISPDGRQAYVVSADANSVTVIDTASNSASPPIPVGAGPRGIAITPDGGLALVANTAEDTVSLIDTASRSVSGAPIPVGVEPEGIAITPDGWQAFVAQRGGDISILDLVSREVVGSIPNALGPSRLALTSSGARGLVTNAHSNSVSVLNLVTGTPIGVPVFVGANPAGIAIASDGHAYAASSADNTTSVIDVASHTRVGSPVSGFDGPAGVAATADGSRVYVANATAGSVSVIDSGSAVVIAQIPVGAAPRGVAVVPNQAPRASFTAVRAEKDIGQTLAFDASASLDPDGRVAAYHWDFGDGEKETGTSPTTRHSYVQPGNYRVTLTVSDEAGCSTELVFTGQTVTCNGSALAGTAIRVSAPDTIRPGFALGGAPRQRLARRFFVVARCSREPCATRFGAVLRGRVKGTRDRSAWRMRGSVRPLRLGIPADGRAKVRLTLSRRTLGMARRALAQGGRVQVTVRASASDAAGNTTSDRRLIRMVRGR